MNEKLLTRKQLAGEISVSPQTVSNYVRKGMPVELRLGGKWLRFNYEKCMNWIKENQKGE